MTNHDRNLPAAQRLPVNARSAGCQAKIVCDLLVETEGESYRLQDAKARTRQTKRDAVSPAARSGANDKPAGAVDEAPVSQ